MEPTTYATPPAFKIKTHEGEDALVKSLAYQQALVQEKTTDNVAKATLGGSMTEMRVNANMARLHLNVGTTLHTVYTDVKSAFWTIFSSLSSFDTGHTIELLDIALKDLSAADAAIEKLETLIRTAEAMLGKKESASLAEVKKDLKALKADIIKSRQALPEAEERHEGIAKQVNALREHALNVQAGVMGHSESLQKATQAAKARAEAADAKTSDVAAATTDGLSPTHQAVQKQVELHLAKLDAQVLALEATEES